MRDEQPQPPSCTAEQLFECVWNGMSDVLGTAATATLMRRSVKRAAVGGRPAGDVHIERQGFEYSYDLPDTWAQDNPEYVEAVREILHELAPLLRELTGAIMIRHLNSLPCLQGSGILMEHENDDKARAES